MRELIIIQIIGGNNSEKNTLEGYNKNKKQVFFLFVYLNCH